MDAREYFDTVRAAQRGIDRRLTVIESMQAREQVRASATTPSARARTVRTS